MTWTQFWDMSSGGGQKLPWKQIYIEAPESEAKELFERFFHRDPYNVTCDCCGEDYSLHEYESLSQATAYHRHCDWGDGGYVEVPRAGWRLITTLEYVHHPDVLVIHADELDSFNFNVAVDRKINQLIHNPAE